MLRLADLEQSKNAVGSVKDIQAHLRRSKADTTANEYMQELPESVGWMVESIYADLIQSQPAASADLLPNATNEDGSPAAICRKEMVGTRSPELLASTVSIWPGQVLNLNDLWKPWGLPKFAEVS
jgi:hypothetical protein